MQYKYCGNENFEDLSGGRVIIHRSGGTNFPVRLAQEIFCRCHGYCGQRENLTVYDPCCGGGYLLTVLGFLNPLKISALTGSDIDEDTVKLAGDNLSLLSAAGMKRRKEHLLALLERHQKPSYEEAIQSAERLSAFSGQTNIRTKVFAADALTYDYAAAGFRADIVITDVPYGKLTLRQGENFTVDVLLERLIPCLNRGAVLAVCSDKAQKIKNTRLKRLEKQSVGKRKFEIFRLPDN